MVTHYLITSLRHLRKRTLFSAITLSGLAFAIALVLLIGVYVATEFGRNRSVRDVDRLYRLVDAGDHTYAVDYRVRDAIAGQLPGVETACLMNRRSVEVNHGEDVFGFSHMMLVDPEFFPIFDIPFVQGNAADALQSIDGLILTLSAARTIFGTADPVGQTVMLDHEFPMTVTGIVGDPRASTSVQADFFVSAANTRVRRLSFSMNCLEYDGNDDSKCRYPYNIFVKLHPHVAPEEVAAQIPGLFPRGDYRFPDAVRLAPFAEDYFTTDTEDHDLLHGNATLVATLGLIGVLILLLAIINYANLSTATYATRLTEIGIRKCLGAEGRSLVAQMFIESLVSCSLAGLAALALAEFFLPTFNSFLDRPITLAVLVAVRNAPCAVLVLVAVAAAAAGLPAFVLSTISPLALFRHAGFSRRSGRTLRGALNIFQFAVAIILVCCVLVMSRQIDYAKHADPGFPTERLLSLDIHQKMRERLPALVDRIRQFHGVRSTTLTNGVPGDLHVRLEGFDAMVIDSTTVTTFGFLVVQGRDLLPGDRNNGCLVNNAGRATFAGGDFRGKSIGGVEVVGVVSDFHVASLHDAIGPMVLMYADWGPHNLTVRIAGPVSDAVTSIRKAWADICPDYPLELRFFDDTFAAMYRNEENLADLIALFALLAVVISCMGVLGLAVAESERRMREIGVRKVLGATSREIVTMLTGAVSRWVLIAALVGLPVAYHVTNAWLQSFAYHVGIAWWVPVLSGGLALFLAVGTVGMQALRVARANPIGALRHE